MNEKDREAKHHMEQKNPGEPSAHPSLIHTEADKVKESDGSHERKRSQNEQHITKWIGVKAWLLKTSAADLGMVIFTMVIAYSTFEYTCYTKRQLKSAADQLQVAKDTFDAAKKSADTAAHELELSQRPWIDFDFRIVGGLHQEANGITLKVNFSLKNFGHSPALDVFPEAIGFVAYKNHMDENGAQEAMCSRMAAAKGFDHLIPQIFPDRPPINQPVIVTFNQSDIDAAKAGGFFHPVVLGCIDYHSSFSDKHLQAPFIYDICWSAPPPANGCLMMTFPIEEWPVENLRYIISLNGSGTTR